jgi:hypothetical protein
VDIGGSVERLVDCAFFDVGARHVAVHVEVDGVSAQSERLANMEQLNV